MEYPAAVIKATTLFGTRMTRQMSGHGSMDLELFHEEQNPSLLSFRNGPSSSPRAIE